MRENSVALTALANILENTALFGDIVLHLPDIAAPILHAKNEWEVLYHWSLSFSSQTSLLDKATHKLIHLVSAYKRVEQELNIIERDPDYVNPYRKQRKKREQHSIREDKLHKSGKKSKKDEKKKKKGPRITMGEL
ncbi:hypothetical protein PR048_010536 [Dryococelus australis]|uniref:Uncharacterized protein n=1 Tax=Dryococelus australis TaxID=614101 RepID=A0ABQ9I329_9NEOP|nr:hypothetical protein PR048_010536 [Dryococelus australis]